jgi:hypothetical protein
MSALHHLRRRRRLWASAALATTGLAAGAVLGTTMTAGASGSTSTLASSTSGTGSTSSGSGNGTTTQPPPSAYKGLPKSGTVTAVGTNSVTISGTTYAVTSTSDIDKNGEATLSDLKVGDAVTFDLDSSASTPTIGHLHAGSESLDRPTGGPAGGPAGVPQGSPPSGTPQA